MARVFCTTSSHENAPFSPLQFRCLVTMCHYQHPASFANYLRGGFHSANRRQLCWHFSMGKTQTNGREIHEHHKRARSALQLSFWRSHASHGILLSIENYHRKMHQLFWFYIHYATKSTPHFKLECLWEIAYFISLFLDSQRSSCRLPNCLSRTKWGENKGIRYLLHSSDWYLYDGFQWGNVDCYLAPICTIPCC